MSDVGLTGIAALEAEMRDRLSAKNAEIEKLRCQLVKYEAALKKIRNGTPDYDPPYRCMDRDQMCRIASDVLSDEQGSSK